LVPGSLEGSVLSFAAAPEPHLRLSCQIMMRDELDGSIALVPQGQR
jgi:ferredoxin